MASGLWRRRAVRAGAQRSCHSLVSPIPARRLPDTARTFPLPAPPCGRAPIGRAHGFPPSHVVSQYFVNVNKPLPKSGWRMVWRIFATAVAQGRDRSPKGVIREWMSGPLSPRAHAAVPRNAARQRTVSPIPTLPQIPRSQHCLRFPPVCPRVPPARPAGALSFLRAHGFPLVHIASR
jgi:hypothetical protein